MPPWPPCGPLLPTRRLKRGPRGLEQKPVPKNVGVGGPGPCGWSAAHRARIQEAMLREAGGPQDPQWRAAASEEEGSGPPGPRRPLQQDRECSGLGGCPGRPRRPLLPRVSHGTVPQGPPAPWQGAQRTEVREATGHPSLPMRSTGGRGRARQRRPDEAQRQRGVRHSARPGSGDPALQRHPTRGLEVTSLGHTSAILTQARAMGSDCTGNCRPPWTDISGRTTQWPKRRQRRLGPPLESGAPARPPPWLARRSIFHLPVGDRTCSPAQLLTRPPQT